MSERVHIVGGGLAGLTVAWELSKVIDGGEIVVYEKLDRLGGKAGSNRLAPRQNGSPNGIVPMSDHGYHLFPDWYKNVIRLMSEVGQDYDREIIPGENFGRAVREPMLARTAGSTGKRRQSATPGGRSRGRMPTRRPAPVDDSTLYLKRTPTRHIPLFVLTAGHLAFRSDRYLENMSIRQFLDKHHPRIGSRAEPMYRTLFLKALSARMEETSALSTAKFFRYWARSWGALRGASWSSLGGSLQRVLISPIEQALLSRGVRIESGVSLVSAAYDPGTGRCIKLAFNNLQPAASVDTTDSHVVFAIPPGDIEQAISAHWPIWDSVQALGDMTTQFAGVDVHFDRLLGLPRNHFGFEGDDSMPEIAATAYNIAPIWPAAEMTKPHDSVIQIVLPEANESSEVKVEQKVRRILATVDISDEASINVNLNAGSRLSLANVGIHDHVRRILETAPTNVLVAGDFMASGISVPSMEAAVGSGLRASRHLAEVLDAKSPSSDEHSDPEIRPSWFVRVVGGLGRLCSMVERAVSLGRGRSTHS